MSLSHGFNISNHIHGSELEEKIHKIFIEIMYIVRLAQFLLYTKNFERKKSELS